MEFISKTQKKKAAGELQVLGEKLVKLSKEQLSAIEMPVEISEAVLSAKTMKSHGARRRQMQYIGTLMRKIDPSSIEEAIYNIEQGDYIKAAEFKETEKWRDGLIAGNKKIMDEIFHNYPDADRQQLMQLVRNAVKERENNKPPRASRMLFRYLNRLRSS